MEIVYTRGCISDGLSISGGDACYYNDLDLNEKKDIIYKLIDKMDEEQIDYEIINLVQNVGEYKYLYHCDQCGDDVEEWSIEI